MEFTVTRTSEWSDKSPCEECIKNKENVWTVGINTLEELITFVQKYGTIVLDESHIEIYDDYRE